MAGSKEEIHIPVYQLIVFILRSGGWLQRGDTHTSLSVNCLHPEEVTWFQRGRIPVYPLIMPASCLPRQLLLKYASPLVVFILADKSMVVGLLKRIEVVPYYNYAGLWVPEEW